MATATSTNRTCCLPLMDGWMDGWMHPPIRAMHTCSVGYECRICHKPLRPSHSAAGKTRPACSPQLCLLHAAPIPGLAATCTQTPGLTQNIIGTLTPHAHGGSQPSPSWNWRGPAQGPWPPAPGPWRGSQAAAAMQPHRITPAAAWQPRAAAADMAATSRRRHHSCNIAHKRVALALGLTMPPPFTKTLHTDLTAETRS